MDFIIKRLELSQEKERMKKLFYDVATERKWNAQKTIEDYNDISIEILALNPMGDVIGATKIVTGDPKLFPIKQDDAWPDLKICDDTKSSEVALVAVDKAYRGNGNIFALLYAKMYWILKNLGIKYIYMLFWIQ